MSSSEALLRAIAIMDTDLFWTIEVAKTVVATVPLLIRQAAKSDENLGAALWKLTIARPDMDAMSRKECESRAAYLRATLQLNSNGRMASWATSLAPLELEQTLAWVYRLWVASGGGDNAQADRRRYVAWKNGTLSPARTVDGARPSGLRSNSLPGPSTVGGSGSAVGRGPIQRSGGPVPAPRAQSTQLGVESGSALNPEMIEKLKAFQKKLDK